jgi:hypothetical protein
MSTCRKCNAKTERGLAVCIKCFKYITRDCPILRRGTNGDWTIINEQKR